MTYHFSKILSGISFDEAVARTTKALNAEGFGILSEIDIQQALKNKLDVDFRKYRILGACNLALQRSRSTAQGSGMRGIGR